MVPEAPKGQSLLLHSPVQSLPIQLTLLLDSQARAARLWDRVWTGLLTRTAQLALPRIQLAALPLLEVSQVIALATLDGL
jgi:hypothetical protein